MLSNAAVKAARKKARAYKMGDAGGLYLYVATTGCRSWRMKYRFDGREQLLTFGTYPAVSLADARHGRDGARDQLRLGVNPSRRSKDVPIVDADGFEAAARRWHTHHLPHWSPVHAADVLASLERDVFPVIGKNSLTSIDPPMILRLLREVEGRGTIETARRLRQRISQIFALAISEGQQVTDPAAIVAKALRRPGAQRHHPALLDISSARRLLEACELVGCMPAIKDASLLLALTSVRLATVRGATWREFEGIDWATGSAVDPLWRVPARRMKLATIKKTDAANDHLVPLSPTAVDVVLAARGAASDVKPDDLVFPGHRAGRPIGEAAIGALYDRAGFRGRHVPHGWRATFSTVMNEAFPEDRDAIDRALAHAMKEKVEAAYNRAAHMERRRWLFDRWAELLRPVSSGTDRAGCPSAAPAAP